MECKSAARQGTAMGSVEIKALPDDHAAVIDA